MKEKFAKANELVKLLENCSEKNRERLAQAIEIKFASTRAAEEHVRNLEELEHLRVQLAQSKKAQDSLRATKTMLLECEGDCNKLKLKYRYMKAKALQYMKQLSFVPWLRDQVWT